MSKNNFRPQKFYEFEIVNEESRVVGKIRIKPSGILWKSRSSHDWLGVDLESFATFMKDNGRKKKH
jgi:hypothetical protein